jgi:hypothetical protein
MQHQGRCSTDTRVLEHAAVAVAVALALPAWLPSTVYRAPQNRRTANRMYVGSLGESPSPRVLSAASSTGLRERSTLQYAVQSL